MSTSESYLVDTNISVTAPTRQRARATLELWMDQHSERLFLSAVTIAEIEAGIAKARRTGATRKAARLTEWLDTLLHLYSDRVLPFDVAVARIAGALSDRARRRGRDPEFADIVIAATARHYQLAILTNNTAHFADLEVAVYDPFVALPC